MRILLFDLNLVFAKQVAKILDTHLKEAQIDFAHNLMLLSHYIKDRKYDLILADTDTAIDSDMAIEILQNTEATVILWSVFDRRKKLRETSGTNIQRVQKPSEPKEVVGLLKNRLAHAHAS